jgi:hypothetical protein
MGARSKTTSTQQPSGIRRKIESAKKSGHYHGPGQVRTITVICNLGKWQQIFAVSQERCVVIASQSATQVSQCKLAVPLDSVTAVSQFRSKNA